MHVYEVRPRKDRRGVDLISDVLPFTRLWYGEPNAISNAVDYAKFRSRSHDAVIRVYDDTGNVIETHEQTGECHERACHLAAFYHTLLSMEQEIDCKMQSISRWAAKYNANAHGG